METEVAIVGAGPAGLSAAVAASEAGCRVTIVDAYARPGGQYYKQMPGEFRTRRPDTLYHDFSRAQQLFARIHDNAHVQLLSGTTVWTAQAASTNGDPVTLYLNTDAGSVELRAEKLILAPGAYDRVLPFPGWDLPGVMTMGAAQTLVKSQRVLPGLRVVRSGSGPFLLPVAAGLAQAGAQVVAVYEATTPLQWARHAPMVSAPSVRPCEPTGRNPGHQNSSREIPRSHAQRSCTALKQRSRLLSSMQRRRNLFLQQPQGRRAVPPDILPRPRSSKPSRPMCRRCVLLGAIPKPCSGIRPRWEPCGAICGGSSISRTCANSPGPACRAG